MSDFTLSGGFCVKTNAAEISDSLRSEQPSLQVLSIKRITGTNGVPDRNRVIVSDGETFMQAMLATTLNDQVDNGSVQKNTVVKVNRWERQMLQKQNILILFEMDVLGTPADRIGNPVRAPAPPPETDAMAIDPPARAPTAAPSVASSSSSATVRPPPAASAARTSEMAAHVFPIEGLNPYHNKWTLKARVTQKSEKKRWSNAKGEGQLFSVNLMDETGEIKATAFGAAVDQLYDLLEEGKVYYITKGRVVLAKKAFSTLANDYEITLDVKTEVSECHDAGNVPNVTYSFVPLDSLASKNANDLVDAIGVVHKVGDTSEITTKQGKPLTKREIVLADQTGFNVTVTLWGKQAETWGHMDNPVVAFKGLKVNEYQGGRSLSAFSSSSWLVDPDIVECHKLRGWYSAEGKDATFTTHSGSGSGGGRAVGFKREEIKPLAEVRNHDGREMQDYFNSRATIIGVKGEPLAYPACKECNKKVSQQGSQWLCEKCNKTYDEPSWRFLLTMQVSDHSSQAWFSTFNDTAQEILGVTADHAMGLKENGDDAGLQKILSSAQGKVFNFSCRARTETYQEQTRVRLGVTRLYPLDWNKEIRYLHEQISGYPGMLPANYPAA